MKRVVPAALLLLCVCRPPPPPEKCRELLLVMHYEVTPEGGATNEDLEKSAAAQTEELKKGGETTTTEIVRKGWELDDAFKSAVGKEKCFDSIEFFGHGEPGGCLLLPYDQKADADAPATHPELVCPDPKTAGDTRFRDEFLKRLKDALCKEDKCTKRVVLHACYSAQLAELIAKELKVDATGYKGICDFPREKDKPTYYPPKAHEGSPETFHPGD